MSGWLSEQGGWGGDLSSPGPIGDITPSTGKFTTLTATDNIVIATAGKGIDFSAASHAAGMTSELLNDYEEGTCTLGITAAVGTVTVNSYYRLGAYVKIGRMVSVSGFIVIDSVSTPSGAWQITGLPFISNADAHGNFQSAASFSQLTTAVGHVPAGDSKIYMVSPNASLLAGGSQIIFQITYQV